MIEIVQTYTMPQSIYLSITMEPLHPDSAHAHSEQAWPDLLSDECPPPASPQPVAEEPADHDTLQSRYYEEFKKIYMTSYHLHVQQQRQLTLARTLKQQISHIETQLNTINQPVKAVKKAEAKTSTRNRRPADEIERVWRCPQARCDRVYASSGSLQQHLKLKHPNHHQPHLLVGQSQSSLSRAQLNESSE